MMCLGSCSFRDTSTREPATISTALLKTAIPPVATTVDLEPGVILLHGDQQRTGVYDLPAVRHLPQVAWQTKLVPTLLTAPLVSDDGLLYTISVNGIMYALDVQTGEEVWSVQGLGQHENAGAIAGEIIISAGVSKQVRARDRHNGKELWSFKTKYPVQGAPLIVRDQVYIATDREVYALDLQSGKLIWSTPTGEDEAYIGSPAYQEGVIYTTGGKLLLALDSQTGNVLWRTEKEEMFLGLAVANNIVYVGNWDHTLYTFDRSTGNELWKFQAEGQLWSAPAVTAETVFVGNEKQLYALAVKDGELLWSFQTGGRVVSEPSLTDGVLYFSDSNHEVRRGSLHLYALDAVTGEQLWAFEKESTYLPGPALGKGVMYISSTGEVTALR